MFGIKTAILHTLFPPLRSHLFPERKHSWWHIRHQLQKIEREYQRETTVKNLGWMITPPQKHVTDVLKRFLTINPNHLGNWSISNTKPWGTQRLERQVIQQMISLYHGNQQHIEGYITTGATEGNIYSAWLGRIHLEKSCEKNEIILLRTDLTHFSIRKAAEIVGIPQTVIPLHTTQWNMDLHGFTKKIISLYRHGFRGFMVPLTLGYTICGTNDNVELIEKTTRLLKKKYSDIHFFVWIDAALNGLILPFINPSFSPFYSPLIQTVIVDFHKFGGVPYPAGVVLYNKKLRNNIEKPTDYLPTTDSTLIGSRQGAVVAAIWAAIHINGKSTYRQTINTQLENKNRFIEKIRLLYPSILVITDPNSVICCIVIPQNTKHISPVFSKEYGLTLQSITLTFTDGKRVLQFYKVYFLPHMTRTVVDKCIQTLQ